MSNIEGHGYPDGRQPGTEPRSPQWDGQANPLPSDAQYGQQAPGGPAYEAPAQYPEASYGQQPYQGMSTDNGKATAALICGILGLVLTVLFWPLGALLDIAAIVLGVMAKKEITRSGGMQRGAGKAKAGLICGIVGLVLLVLILAFVAANYDEIMRQVNP